MINIYSWSIFKISPVETEFIPEETDIIVVDAEETGDVNEMSIKLVLIGGWTTPSIEIIELAFGEVYERLWLPVPRSVISKNEALVDSPRRANWLSLSL